MKCTECENQAQPPFRVVCSEPCQAKRAAKTTRDWHARNPDKVRAGARARRLKNPEKARAWFVAQKAREKAAKALHAAMREARA